MFNNSKYTKCYFAIIEQAKKCPSNGYTERHHIIPKSLGGGNEKSNIVRLTARAHFICHKLLIRMVEGQSKYKMIEALAIFSNNKNRKLTLNSRDIAQIREANSQASSIRNKSNQYYLNRPPASDDLRSLRSENAKQSKWVNNGAVEKFTKDWNMFIQHHNFQLGRLPFDEDWIAKIISYPNKMSTPEANAKKSKALKGRPKTESHRRSLSVLKKQAAQVKINCTHCGKSVDFHNYNKWHGDNCSTVKSRVKVECEHCRTHATYANYRRWHGINCKVFKGS